MASLRLSCRIGASVIRLAESLYLPEAVHRGRYHRLRVGLYRVVYIVENDLITVGGSTMSLTLEYHTSGGFGRTSALN